MSIKNKLDQYYTNPDYAKHCFEISQSIISEKINFESCFFLEPCVGTGSFYKLFPEGRKFGFDIEPVYKDENVTQADFLEQMFVNQKCPNSDMIVISNPPFGRLSSLAVKFFNKCANIKEVKYISFIVPLTFRKVATQNKLHENFHLIYDEISPHDAFILHGEPHHVPCVLQIWERRDDEIRTKHEIKNKSEYFTYCKKDEADLYIKRVGTKAGEIAVPGTEHKDASMYYIKTEHKDKIYQIMNSESYLTDIKAIRQTTAGVYCVSKSELVINIEKYW